VRPQFVLGSTNYDDVTAICRRLDGLPLAIELAAARMITMTPADLLPRLEDSLALLVGGPRNAADRQRTLRATIDWSHRVLSENERLLLQRMSVLTGERDTVTVEAICGTPPLDGQVLALALGRLAEKSMVQVRQDGETIVYRLLATVREYAAERLSESGRENAVRDRHLAHYRALASAAFEARRVRGALPEHHRLWREIDDVRAALEWGRDDPGMVVEMLGWMGWVWMMYAPEEGRRRIGELLPSVAETRPPATWYIAAGVYAALSGRAGDPGPDMKYGPPVLAHAIDVGDRHVQGSFELGAAFIKERFAGDLAGARAHLVNGVDLLERAGNGPELALALQSLGSVERQLGNLDAARASITRSIEKAVAIDDRYNAVGAYFHLGWLELDEGAMKPAVEAFAAGLEFADDSDLLSVAHQVEGVAVALTATDAGAAGTMLGAAASLRERVGNPLLPPWSVPVEEASARVRATLAEDGWQQASAQGNVLPVERLREMVKRAVRPAAGRAAGDPVLSRRELQVADLVAAGMTNRAIADKLFLSERTVESHVEHIRNKLQFNSRAQVAAWVTERQV
ncbi:MAG: LuxR C-terminal-related transcriptional regulator, partial [Candidatus Dormibacteraeota bacterium]|nr:LuxR C-terminal-related transcriptional regulator [Candidatus Dormibacteraeota bacterium]